MGLDNGIILNCSDKYNTQVLNYIFHTEPSNKVKEICYWRKCHGLRNDIVAYLKAVYPNKENYYTVYLNAIDIFNIRQIIINWQNKTKWNSYGKSIWSYKEIKKSLKADVEKLTFLLGMLEFIDSCNLNDCGDLELYFYDSY